CALPLYPALRAIRLGPWRTRGHHRILENARGVRSRPEGLAPSSNPSRIRAELPEPGTADARRGSGGSGALVPAEDYGRIRRRRPTGGNPRGEQGNGEG